MLKENIYKELMIEAYKAATPPADYEELYDKAPLNELGQKIIPYKDHIISIKDLDDIFDSVMKKYKVKPYMVKLYRFYFYMGPSPSYPKNAFDDEQKEKDS